MLKQRQSAVCPFRMLGAHVYVCWRQVPRRKYLLVSGGHICKVMMQTLTSGVHVLWLWQTNSYGLQKSCKEKETAWPLSEWESTLTPAWTGFYCLSGHITSRKVSFTIHRFAVGDYLLQITKERMLLITSKKRMLQMQGEKWLNWLHSILGRFSTDFMKLL